MLERFDYFERLANDINEVHANREFRILECDFPNMR